MDIDCAQPPVLIVATPKSGSSMVAAIFVAHGLWVGNYGLVDSYESFSNSDIDQLQSRRGRRRGEFPRLLRQLNPDNQRWMLKGKPKQIFEVASYLDNFCIVKVRRPIDDTYRSRGYVDRAIIEAHLKQMDKLNGPSVQTEAVVRGDFSTLEIAFKHCGMQFNPDIARACINREIWSTLNKTRSKK